MKLLGRSNGKKVIASISHYDCIGVDGMLVDGGILGTAQYAGYNRIGGEGETIWFEVTQTYSELYNDYRDKHLSPRKYGIWDIKDVKVLSPEEYPDTESFEWRAENAIWGTNGIDGTQRTKYVHLKDCPKEHLEKIVELCKLRDATEILKFAEHWLNQK